MTHAKTSCPSCESKATVCLGKIRNGIGIIRLTDSGKLYRCRVCSLVFRHPFLSSSELIQQYSLTPPNLWQREESPDFKLAAQAIRNTFPSGRILDIGCFRGDFLWMLPSRYEKYGVEPSHMAREFLTKRNIKLVGRTVDQIEFEKPMFHVITLLDLIEHLPHPLASLRKARKLLLPGGLFIISTGNTDALPWRLMQLDYWYYFTEHVSFFNRKWFRWAAKQLDLKIIASERFSHFKGTNIERWTQIVRCVLYRIMKHGKGESRVRELMARIYPFRNAANYSSPPSAHLWRDHIFLVFRSES